MKDVLDWVDSRDQWVGALTGKLLPGYVKAEWQWGCFLDAVGAPQQTWALRPADTRILMEIDWCLVPVNSPLLAWRSTLILHLGSSTKSYYYCVVC